MSRTTTKTIEVSHFVEVTVDESKFTEEFMQEFSESFFPIDTIDEHREHLAQMYARGVCDDDGFIEGYGPAKDMGIKFKTSSVETSVQD